MTCFCFVPTTPLVVSGHSSFSGTATPQRSRPRTSRRDGVVLAPARIPTQAPVGAPVCLQKMGLDAHILSSVSTLLADATSVNIPSLGATAFVFFLTFWGGISFVKGSTKDRITQASFTVREPASEVAKKTSRYLMERAFTPDMKKDKRKGVVTFTGKVRASSSVASILVAVGASGIWSLTYILNFLLPDALKSDYWGLLSLSAFAVVPWYWENASREEEVKVLVEQDEDLSTLFVKAHRDEIIELEKAFNWKRNEVEDDEKVVATAKSIN